MISQLGSKLETMNFCSELFRNIQSFNEFNFCLLKTEIEGQNFKLSIIIFFFCIPVLHQFASECSKDIPSNNSKE